jgi:ACS family pantothenate transporter-like MFS transporter
MSLPVALSVWWFLPDLPHNTKAWYITEEEKQIALRRSATQGYVQVTGKLDKALAKRMFGSWRWWVLCATYILVSISCSHFHAFAPLTPLRIVRKQLRGCGLFCHLLEYIPTCHSVAISYTY